MNRLLLVESRRGHGLTDEEGVAVGNRVRLPRGAERPYTVYINGVRQSEGEDYTVEGREVVFREPIVKEGTIRGWRKLTLLLGVVGVYRKHEIVDVEYRLAGKPRLASDLDVIGSDA